MSELNQATATENSQTGQPSDQVSGIGNQVSDTGEAKTMMEGAGETHLHHNLPLEGGRAKSKGEASAKAGETPALQGAPEAYAFKAPEGVVLGDEIMTAYGEVAKELKLSQENAQKVLDKVAPLIAKEQAQAIETTVDGWRESSKADKEFGGDKLGENLAIAKKGLDAYATPELRAMLNQSGLGDHPEVIRLFWKLGQTVKEDTFIGGTSVPAKETTMEERMFKDVS
ncbi:MAG: protease [Burkholderiales bacterium]|jgi:hypothetical protein|nr:protease [Burkholderiales bacterium]